METGEVITVHLPSPYPGLAGWRIDQVQGSSARVGPMTVAGDGDVRFTLTATQPGTTRIMATFPGPHAAPTMFVTLTAAVRS